MIEEFSWRDDLDASEMLERLEVVFVSCDQIIRSRRNGAFQDAMVVRILRHAGKA